MRDYVETAAGNEYRVRFVWLLRVLRKLVPPASRRERILRWSLDKFRQYIRLLRNDVLGGTDRRFNKWLHENKPDLDLLERQASAFETLDYKPHISIIIQSRSKSLEKAPITVRSVEAQTIPRWDLTLLVDSSGAIGVPGEHKPGFVEDERLQLRFLNSGIDSLVDILSGLRGDFVVWLFEGDRLAPDMLWEIVSAIQINPDSDLLYTDEDTFDALKNRRTQPWLKPDWSPELMLSINYLTPLIVRKSILAEVIAEGSWSAKDADLWDLTFRCVEKARTIIHIPKILYHTSMPSLLPGSVGATDSNVVVSYLERNSIKDAHMRERSHGWSQIVWSTRSELVSIVIPTKDHPSLLRRCMDGILHHTSYPHIQVIIIDTGSLKNETMDYYDQIVGDDRVRLVSFVEQFNYSTVNNFGARHAEGEHLLFLNNDIEVIEGDWLAEMVRWSECEEIGAVGAKLLFPDRTIQHAGIVIGLGGHSGHVFRGTQEGESGPFGTVDWYRNYLAVTGACLMIPRSVFLEVSGFNEDYQLAFSDVEIGLKIIEQGYRVLYTPFARLIHHESVTRGRHIPTEDIVMGYEELKHYFVNGDPYFNPNLSYMNPIPSLRMQPENRIQTFEKILARRLAVEGKR